MFVRPNWDKIKNKMHHCVPTALLVLALSMAAGASPAAASPAAQPACTTQRVAAMVSAPIHVEKAFPVRATLQIPSHCIVTGYIEHGSRIDFALGLPDAWNKRYLFLGIGGFAGILDLIDPGLAKGYATATGDTGHQGASVQDASWAKDNPAAIINHFETGTALAARDLKGLTAVYYGELPARSYFEGCSAGGRQGIVEAEQYPSTFDGIIAGAPAWNYSKLLITFVENGRMILKSPSNWIDPQTFDAIDRLVTTKCGDQDGVQDGLVTDPKRCNASLRALLCRAGTKGPGCLTPAQRATIDRLIYPEFTKNAAGYFGYHLSGSMRDVDLSWGWSKWFFGTKPPVVDKSGALNFRGDVLPVGADAGIGPNQFLLGEEFLRYIAFDSSGFDARKFDMKSDGGRLDSKLGGLLDADDTDLGPFFRLGGKLIIWHGWADPAIPPGMSIDLYQRIARDTKVYPGQSPTDRSVRLFMVPGVQHCGGGTGLTDFDPLTAMTTWVEHGDAPDRIVARQLIDQRYARSRPLCPYPKFAHYKGSGVPNDAASFVCR